jgi:hypothetical protein
MGIYVLSRVLACPLLEKETVEENIFFRTWKCSEAAKGAER